MNSRNVNKPINSILTSFKITQKQKKGLESTPLEWVYERNNIHYDSSLIYLIFSFREIERNIKLEKIAKNSFIHNTKLLNM